MHVALWIKEMIKLRSKRNNTKNYGDIGKQGATIAIGVLAIFYLLHFPVYLFFCQAQLSILQYQ
jgi:hypothetical protein